LDLKRVYKVRGVGVKDSVDSVDFSSEFAAEIGGATADCPSPTRDCRERRKRKERERHEVKREK
jgi:hypothetical protein